MISRRTFAGALLLGGHVLWAGCTTSGERNAMLDVVRRLNTLEAEVPTNPRDNEYVLKRMEFARAAVVNGAYERAEVRLTQAFQQLESEHSNVAAAISSEEHKFYKGETYERAMLCFYLGYIKYFLGDYNEARICFERAIAADRAAVVKESTPISHGEDFGLAYYWLGKAYQKLNNMDAAAIAFKRAGQQVQRAEAEGERQEDCAKATVVAKRRQEGEAWAYRTFHDPKQPKWYIAETADLSDGEAAVRACAAPGSRLPAPVIRRSQSRAEFLTPRFQGQVNLTLTIELGDCPWKYLTGCRRLHRRIFRGPRVQAAGPLGSGRDAGPYQRERRCPSRQERHQGNSQPTALHRVGRGALGRIGRLAVLGLTAGAGLRLRRSSRARPAHGSAVDTGRQRCRAAALDEYVLRRVRAGQWGGMRPAEPTVRWR
jgi:hypothetical protein